MQLADYEWVHEGGWTTLYGIPPHPSFDKLRTKDVSDSIVDIINQRKCTIGDTLTTSSFFYCWKPYFEWLKSIDPHYTVSPLIVYDIDYSAPDYQKKIVALNKSFRKKARIIPVTVLDINDTLIVKQTLDPQLRYGDILLSVNDIPVKEITKVSYSERHAFLYQMLMYYSFSTICDNYKVEIMRDDVILELEIKGIKTEDAMYELALQNAIEDNIRVIGDGVGYIKIAEFFPDNSRLIRIFSNAIKEFKKEGVKDLILDLRGNPGGNGDSFDKLLSLVINKEEIDYCSSKELKVSRASLRDYKFITEDMIGQTVEIPENELLKTLHLKNKQFVDGMTYYVLMDKGTFSMAATFCNVMQFNGAAILVGEPLLKNALLYGDTINVGRSFYPGGKTHNLPFYAGLIERGISTSMTHENTKAIDGILTPDIYIPYDIEALSNGKDNMLEELVKTIRKKRDSE